MYKAILLKVVIVCVGLLIPVGATAKGIQSGTLEFTTDSYFDYSGFSFDGDGIGNSTNLQVSAGVGYFATSLIEVSGSLVFTHTSLDPDEGESFSASQFGGIGSLSLNFATSGSAIPFVGAGLGVLGYSGDAVDDPKTTLLLPRLTGGVRFPVGDSASLNLLAVYAHLLNARGIEDVSANEFLIGFGVSIFLTRGVRE